MFWSSIRTRLLIFWCITLAVVAAAIITISTMSLFRKAVDAARQEVLLSALRVEHEIRDQMELGFGAARTLAHALQVQVDPDSEVKLTRDQVNAILRQIVLLTPQIVGACSQWEPNAFDGRDAEFAGTEMHDHSGRFIPYWYLNDNGLVLGEPLHDYDDAEWWTIPRQSLKESVIEPYSYELDGKDVSMITFSVPIKKNDAFFGICTVDIELGFIQYLVDNFELFDGRATIAIISSAGELLAVNGHQEFRGLQVVDTFPQFSRLLSEAPHSGATTHESEQTLSIVSQIHLGNTDSTWYAAFEVPMEQILASPRKIMLEQIFGGLICTLMGMLILSGLIGRMTTPIRQAADLAHKIRAGDLSQRLNVKGKDEIGILGNALDEMTEAMEKQLQKYQKLTEQLEEKVQDRTRDLEKKNSELETFYFLVEQSPSVIVFTDIDGTIEFVNPAFCHSTGYTKEEAIGRNPRILKSGKVPDSVYSDLWQTIKKGRIWTGELINQKKNGELYWEAAKIAPIKDRSGNIRHFLGMKEDISKRKETEEKLRQATKKAEHASRAKSEFIANMSHEIRTPMNAVLGMSHLTLQTDLTRKQKDYVTKINIAANSLLGIINDLLDFSKIEAGKMEIESDPFMMEEVLESLSNLVTMKTREKRIEFLINTDPEVPARIAGDSLRLSQVLINLVNNAVKFTDKGEIVLKIEKMSETDGEIVLKFSVQDTGIGMSEKESGRLFQAFSQADSSTTRKFGGTGLGLAISKRLVEMMGGEIGVKSTPGKGSIFSFTAVFEKQDIPETDLLIIPESLKDLRVLVVDDSHESREILTRMITSFRLSVTETDSGHKAIALLIEAVAENRPYGLILMDYKMPEMNGIETIRRIIDHPVLVERPQIIVVTAYGREVIRKEVESLAIEGFLMKPIVPSVLYDTMVAGIFGLDSQVTRQVVHSELNTDALAPIAGAHVLLVEDHPVNQQVAKGLLKHAQLKVTIVGNGAEAVDAVKQSKFDAVLMDIQMPVMDGFEATKTIRSHSEFNDLPIIAMTAHAMVDERAKCLDFGMNDHVAKPIEPKKLYAALIRWIKPGERAIPQALGHKLKRGDADASLPELNLPGFDIEQARHRFGGDVSSYRDALCKAVGYLTGSMETITRYLEEGDVTSAAGEAHALKGLSGNIGAVSAFALAETLEKALTQPNGLPENELIEQLTACIAVTVSTIESDLEAAEKQKRLDLVTENSGNPASVAQTLWEQIDNFDSSASDTCNDLMTMVTGSEFEIRVQEIAKSLDIYDFDNARNLVDDLMRKMDA